MSRAVLLLAALTACGGGSSGSPDAATVTPDAVAVSPDAAPPSAQPPAPGPAHAPDGSGATTFAITKLFLGDTDPDGTPDQVHGWKNYGYDIDRKDSSATSTDLCQPRDNASPVNVYPDGPDGIDNGFGHGILPLLLGLASDATAKVNDGLASGAAQRLLFTLPALGSADNYNPIDAADYGALALGSLPRFDGTDVWPIDDQTIVNDDVSMPVVRFPDSYLVGNVWVSGDLGAIELRLQIDNLVLPLRIQHAVVTMQLSADHQSASRGQIAGLLSTDQLVSDFDVFASSLDPQLCSGATIQAINMQIDEASDILQDGTQDPAKICDGISIGVGFEAAADQLGAPATAPTGPANPC